MRIELSNENPPKLIKEGLQYTFQLEAVLSIDKKEEPLKLNKVRMQGRKGESEEFQLCDENGNELQNPILIEPGTKRKIQLILKETEANSSLLRNDTKFNIVFFLLAEKDEVKEVAFQFKGLINQNSSTFSKFSFKRVGVFKLFLSLTILLGIFLLLNLWVSQNEGVFRQAIPSYVFNLGLSASLLFIGINFGSLKKAFLNISAAKDFFNTPELYFHNDTLGLLKNKNFALFLAIVLIVSGFLCGWYFFPMRLGINQNQYSVVYNNKGKQEIITQEKIYYGSLGNVFVTLKKDSVDANEDLTRLQIGKIIRPLFPIASVFNGDLNFLNPDTFSFDNSCSDCLVEYQIAYDTEQNKLTFPQIRAACLNKKINCFCEIQKTFFDNGDSTVYRKRGNNIFDTRNSSIWKDEIKSIVLESIFVTAQREKDKIKYVRDEINGHKANASISSGSLLNFTNSKLEEIASSNTFDFQNDENAANKLNTLWAFCSYIEENDYIYLEDSLHVASILNEILKKNVGADNFAVSFVNFAINTHSKLIVDRQKIDSILISYLDFKPTGNISDKSLELRNKRIDLVLKSLEKNNAKMDKLFTGEFVSILKQLEFERADSVKRLNLSRMIIAMNWMQTSGSIFADEYILDLHNKIVDLALNTKELSFYYFSILSRSGLSPKSYQLEYFQKFYCAWGGGGPDNNWAGKPIIYSNVILEENGSPSTEFIQLAKSWDNKTYWTQKCGN